MATKARRGGKRAARPLSLYKLAGPLPVPTAEIARKCREAADAWVKADDARQAREQPPADDAA